MGELYEPFPKLPKNFRQIGERDQVLKLYLEDYVNTYLKRLQPAKGADLRVGLLLGSRETHEDIPFVFVDGALEMDSVTEEGGKVAFTEDAWKKAYQDVEQMFPKRTVQGWFLCAGPGCTLSPLTYWKQHSQYFTGKNQLMYLNCGLEGEEAVYITSSDGFYKLRGYSIYYERNQMMQDYMILRKDVPRAETGVDDKVIQNFKQKMDERRVEAGRHRSTVGVLSGLCSVLAVTVLAGGVAMFNNYQKLHQMESVIASVVPEGNIKDGLMAFTGKGGTENPSGKGWSAADEPDYVIEEASGKVYPTTAPSPENGDEKPSRVTPETLAPSNSGQTGGTGQGSGQTAAAVREAARQRHQDHGSGQTAASDREAARQRHRPGKAAKRRHRVREAARRRHQARAAARRAGQARKMARHPARVSPRLIQPRRKMNRRSPVIARRQPRQKLRLMIPHFRQPEEEGNRMTRPCQLPATRCIPWRTVRHCMESALNCIIICST